MPDYLHPGVYVEEIARGPRPIEGVPTSTAAILGDAERGPITPRLVTSYDEYRRWFGDAGPDGFLADAVNGFFLNGGQRAFICRLAGHRAATASAPFGDFAVRASGPGAWGNRVFAKISPGSTKDAEGRSIGFKLQLACWSSGAGPFDVFGAGDAAGPPPSLIEEFDDLAADGQSPDYYGRRLPFIDLATGDRNDGPASSALGVLVRNAGVPADARPADGGRALSGGAADPAPPGVGDGLAELERDAYRDVALIYAPGASSDDAKAVVAHCERMRFRFAVIDCDKGRQPDELGPRSLLGASRQAAFYYPWLMTADLRDGALRLVPPGGHVLGVYARTDSERGVFKAPANAIVRGAIDLEREIDDRVQDGLHAKGVNAIRRFPGRGILVWGARTMSSDPLWKYVSVRRLVVFLERSIDEGTQWVVFEPNDERLWARVVDTIRLFLRAQWRQGALFGRTEQEAFFITCDRTTMTQDDILNGRLICEVGLAPVRPAEFVVVRVFQHTAEAQR
jgi:Bacteriophage tail sheath protein